MTTEIDVIAILRNIPANMSQRKKDLETPIIEVVNIPNRKGEHESENGRKKLQDPAMMITISKHLTLK